MLVIPSTTAFHGISSRRDTFRARSVSSLRTGPSMYDRLSIVSYYLALSFFLSIMPSFHTSLACQHIRTWCLSVSDLFQIYHHHRLQLLLIVLLVCNVASSCNTMLPMPSFSIRGAMLNMKRAISIIIRTAAHVSSVMNNRMFSISCKRHPISALACDLFLNDNDSSFIHCFTCSFCFLFDHVIKRARSILILTHRSYSPSTRR
jgi:hypothetical protein